MVRFSELRFTEDKSKMHISCYVEDFDVYEGVYIKSVSVEYYKNRLSSGNVSDKAITIFSNSDDDADTTVRTFTYTMQTSELEPLGLDSFEDGIFYVYVECDGFTGTLATVDCSWGRAITTGVAIDWERIYRVGMANINSALCSSSRCRIDSGLIDYVLMWNAFKLALETCDFDTAEDLWDKFLGNGGTISFTSTCGCH